MISLSLSLYPSFTLALIDISLKDYALREANGVTDLLTVRDNAKAAETEFSAELHMLFEAAYANDVALLKELLAKPLSANTTDPDKSTPIFAAAYVVSLYS